MQLVSWAWLLTCGIAASGLLVGGAAMSEVHPCCGANWGSVSLYGPPGYFLFVWFEVQGKRRGTLELTRYILTHTGNWGLNCG